MSFSVLKTFNIKASKVFCSLTLVNFYSKNVLRRNPIKVHNVSTNSDLIPPIREDFNLKAITESNFVQNESVTISTENRELVVPPYVKLQKNDARFTQVIDTMKNRKRREKYGKILIEGKRLINDALAAGVELKTIYFSREKDIADIKLRNVEKVEICKVLYKTLRVWSELTTCPGVMGVFKRPTLEDINVMSEPAIPVTVICDNIRDPGNLGSIIRNSAAAGCRNVILTKGCVDPWEVKVLRAGCGGHFRIPIINDVEWTHVSNYLPKECTIFVADNSGDITEQEFSSDTLIFDESKDEIEEETKYLIKDEQNQLLEIDETYNMPSELEKFEDFDIPCYLYTSVKFPKKDIVLYIGGETAGVDPKVGKLIYDYGGKKIKIPLENGMESLNNSFAMTIILYEIKRQIKETYVTK